MKSEDYYSIKKIMQIIKYYHINIRNIRELQQDMKSVGVARYGEDSALPTSNKFSSVVENEVLRQIENTKFWSELITDMKYLQDRWGRITDENDAKILSLRLDGYSVSDIAYLMKTDRSNVYRSLKRIARQIKGYPQASATDSTNYQNKDNS